MHLHSLLRPPGPLLLGALLLWGAGPLAAQSGASGSETLRSTARNLSSAGNRSTSTDFVIESELGFPTAGPALASTNYSFRGSALWTGNDFTPPGPVVFGVMNDQGTPGAVGTKLGGEVETVVGVGFQAAGTPVVTFAGLPATNVLVVSDSELSVVSPPGQNALGNALTEVELSVSNALGSALVPNAYHNLPALIAGEEPLVGETWRLTYLGEVGSFSLLFYGVGTDGVGLPLPPFGGSLEILSLLTFVGGIAQSSDGPGVDVFHLPIPDKLSLLGKSLDWQAISWDLVFTPDSFTNRLTSVIGQADCN